MPKPIFLVGLPIGTPKITLRKIYEELKGIRDYHHLIYINTSDNYEFKVFYEKDFNEVKYDELQKIIKENIGK